MKILLVSPGFPRTDAAKTALEIAKQFASQHQVVLITKKDEPIDLGFLQHKHSVIDPRMNNLEDEDYPEVFREKVSTAQALIQQHQPNLISVHSLACSEWIVAARLEHVRNIVHVYETPQDCISLLNVGRTVPGIMDQIDKLVCPLSEMTRNLKEIFSTLPKNCQTIAPFFDCETLIQLSQVQQPLPTNAQGNALNPELGVIGACGAAIASKGIEVFYRAAAELPHLQFLWIGEWSSNNLFQNPVEQQWMIEKPDNFFVVDKFENLYFYLNLANLVVSSSSLEAIPLVVLEALVLGKQVACFSKAGLARFLLDRWGYVLSGYPDTKLLVALIDRLFPPPDYQPHPPDWLGDVQQHMTQTVHQKEAFSKLEPLLEFI